MSEDPSLCAACGNSESDTATATGTSLCANCIAYLILNSRLIPRTGSVLPTEQRRLGSNNRAQPINGKGLRRDTPGAGHSSVIWQQVEGVNGWEGGGWEKSRSQGSCRVGRVENWNRSSCRKHVGQEKSEFGVQKVIREERAKGMEEGLLVNVETTRRGEQGVRRFPLVIRPHSYKGFHEVLQRRFGIGGKLLVEYQNQNGDFVPVAGDDAVNELYRVAQMWRNGVLCVRLGTE